MEIGRRSYSYSGYAKLEKEDPEERKHRQAQFLINKKLLQVEDRIIMRRSSSSRFRLRSCRLKVRIGSRALRRLKKCMCMSGNYVSSKAGFCRHLVGHLKSWRSLFRGPARHRPEPLFV